MLRRELFSESDLRFREGVADFLEREIAPNYPEWEANGIVPKDAWRRAGDAGLLCRTVSRDYGGPGESFLRSVIVIEEVSKRRLSGFMTYLQSDIVVPYLIQIGSESQKRRYLPDCVTGRRLAAVAITEPHCGSDLAAMKTSASKGPGGYRITGTKTHVSGGTNADLIVVATRTAGENVGREGTSLLLVETPIEGLDRIALPKAGLRALDTSSLVFAGTLVSEDCLLGAEGMGFLYLVKLLTIERLVLAISAQAACNQILRETIGDCGNRVFSRGSVLDFQNTRFALADLISECVTNQVFIDRCIIEQMRGDMNPTAACIAKLRTTELLKRIALQAVQFRGARGVGAAAGDRAAQDLLDACVQTIWGGTNEVMKDIIGQGLETWTQH